MSRSKRTGSTQKVGSGNRHHSGKSKNTPTRKGKEAESKVLDWKRIRTTDREGGIVDVAVPWPEKHQRKIEEQDSKMPKAMRDVMSPKGKR